jgi:hypothetical protein
MKTIIERRRKRKQEKEVRAWSNPHKQLALAMLRNFILLLKYKASEGEGSQGKYHKEMGEKRWREGDNGPLNSVFDIARV